MDRRPACTATALLVASAALGLLAPVASAATREPLPQALAQAHSQPLAVDSAARPSAAALREMTRGSARRFAAAAGEFSISSSHYGPTEVDAVAGALRSLDHGPEMATLSVYVATPEEIARICGATVVACYLPSEREMVVSGVDRPVAGVPRDFAIAHEYGHHIANSQQGSALPALEAGTSRWATYERVCQLTRSGRLHPGDQGAHYWEDPEEAFAQSYARLNMPIAPVSWQYTPLLRPTVASLTRIHADVIHPWSGPVMSQWSGSLASPPADAPAEAAGDVGLAAARAVGAQPLTDTRLIQTPLDGPVSASLQTQVGAALSLTLRDPADGRVLARAATAATGEASLSYSNCGHATLRLEVRSRAAANAFQASIARP